MKDKHTPKIPTNEESEISSHDVDSQRRKALKTLGSVAVAGAAVGTLSTQAIAQSSEMTTEQQTSSTGYHETQHIRDYYDSCKG